MTLQKRILIVDDEEALLLAFKKLLKRPNVDIDTCESKEDALKQISNFTYDIIIVDLRLSGTLEQEGFEIIKFAKNKSTTTKVVLITAYGNYDIKEKALECGADFYFEKPVSIKNLYEIIDSDFMIK